VLLSVVVCQLIHHPELGAQTELRRSHRIESAVSRGTQTQFLRTPYSRVTGPPGTTSVSELLSREIVGVEASEHQRLMSGSRVPERLVPHLAMETSRSASGSISGGSHLVRDQVEDLGEMPRSR
jgi:hypothetical protein